MLIFGLDELRLRNALSRARNQQPSIAPQKTQRSWSARVSALPASQPQSILLRSSRPTQCTPCGCAFLLSRQEFAMTEPAQFTELSMVALRHTHVCREGKILPRGSVGTIVHVWRGGAGYEVEFDHPFHCVTTLKPGDITNETTNSRTHKRSSEA